MTMLEKLARVSGVTLAAWSVPCAIVLFFSVNTIASLRGGDVRLDLTEDKVYTVSASTREVLKDLDEPITLRLYRSSALVEEVPELRTYSERVTELLRTYEHLSENKLRIDLVDPVSFSPAEDKAIGYGLAGFNLSRSGEQGYFGVVGTNSVDQLEIIEALSPAREQYLEYELTRMVMRLASPTEPRIGVIDGLGLFGSMSDRRSPSALINRLGDDFALVPIEQDVTALPESLDGLIIIHPAVMTPSALYAVDQYVLGGGAALVYLDPLAEHSPPDPSNQSLPLYPDSALDPLMAAWGLEMVPKKIVGDVNMALPIRAQAGNQVAMTNYPPWLIVDQDNFQTEDAVTGRLNLMRMSSAGALQPVEGAKTSFTPLIHTTPTTMLYDQVALMRRNDPRELMNMFASSDTVRTLAARVAGEVSTAFPDGPPEGAATAAPHREASEGSINVVVVSDTDMLADDHNINSSGRSTTQNIDFAINALDSLTGGGALHELRSRSLSFRPFTLVNQIEADAQAKYRATEQQLQAELQQTQEKLAELRVGAVAADGQVVTALSQEQQKTVADFNHRIIELRDELRGVQAALRKDVDALTGWLQLLNTLAVPALIVLVGGCVAVFRQWRLSRYLRGFAPAKRSEQ